MHVATEERPPPPFSFAGPSESEPAGVCNLMRGRTGAAACTRRAAVATSWPSVAAAAGLGRQSGRAAVASVYARSVHTSLAPGQQHAEQAESKDYKELMKMRKGELVTRMFEMIGRNASLQSVLDKARSEMAVELADKLQQASKVVI